MTCTTPHCHRAALARTPDGPRCLPCVVTLLPTARAQIAAAERRAA